MKSIDLNADAGESFGRWQLSDEAALFPLLSSVNLACGFHAGDPSSIKQAVALAYQHNLAIGAHPSFPDRVGFGRRDMAVSAQEIHSDVLYQLGALAAFLRKEAVPLHHVKAHGALYLKMMQDRVTAEAFIDAVLDFDSSLPVLVLAGEGGAVMQECARAAGVRTVGEAFPDRAYLANGQLAPRSRQGAVLQETSQIAEHAIALATGHAIPALDGGWVEIEAETLCLHGDNPQAVASAREVGQALHEAGISIKAF